MTLDVLHFILEKGGNPDEIRESQRKRGLPEDIVDEVARMYGEWAKRTHSHPIPRYLPDLSSTPPQSTTMPQN